jgi:hypothetical protein
MALSANRGKCLHAPPRDEAPPPDCSGTSVVTSCDPAAFPARVASTAPRHGSPPRCGKASRMPYRSAGLISWLAWRGACRCTLWASGSSRTTGQTPASLPAAREAAGDVTTVLPDVEMLPSEVPGAVVAGGTAAALGATLQPPDLRDVCDSQLHAAIPSTNATPILAQGGRERSIHRRAGCDRLRANAPPWRMGMKPCMGDPETAFLASWRHGARNSPPHAARNPCKRRHGFFPRQDAKRTCLFSPRRRGVRRELDTQEMLACGSGCDALPCGP